MEVTVKTLGKVLAFWEKNVDNSSEREENLQLLSTPEKDLLAYLQNRLNESGNPDSKIDSFNLSILGHNADQTHTEKAIDFLLLNLFPNSAAASHFTVDHIDELYRNLNNDLNYFEHFSDIMRSYYHSSQDFDTTKG